MLRFDELIQLIVLISTLVICLYAIIKTIFDCYDQDFREEKNYSISKTQKDIEKRLKNVKKVKKCLKK